MKSARANFDHRATLDTHATILTLSHLAPESPMSDEGVVFRKGWYQGMPSGVPAHTRAF